MKDAFWFKHDSNASRDMKLIKIRALYDFWGTGLYWAVVEFLREQDGYMFQSDELSLKIVCECVSCKDVDKFMQWFNDCCNIKPEPLFIVKNGLFYSESLCKRMQKWETLKANGNKGGRPTKPDDKPEAKPERKPRRKPVVQPLDKIRLEYIDKSIEEAWLKWVEFKKSQFKFEYKSIESEQIAINELVGLCNGKYLLAGKIVDQSIANGWKGLFPLKQEHIVETPKKKEPVRPEHRQLTGNEY